MKGMKIILLVEDDRVDAMTVKRALKSIHVNNPVAVVGNGEEGIAWLRDPQNEQPCIILLDLNMPRMNGIEFLNIIKQEERFRTIPVVVLTTSKDELDRARSFDLGVAGYMVKPVDYLQFVEVIRTINLYWTLSELPT
ncbi:MAG: response regulator [Magnetococcales bacterium]|nr:response regulator [Magnetococcales bacterium]